MFFSLYVAVFLAVFFVKNSDSAARCSSFGDGRYNTFDGKRYTFKGRCEYILARVKKTEKDVYVVRRNNACYSAKSPCIKSLTVLAKGLNIKIGRGNRVSVNGKPTLINPINPVVNRGISISRIGRLVKVQVDDLTVKHNYMSNDVYVTVENYYRGKTEGLCGNFNGNQNDDGIQNYWTVRNSCPKTRGSRNGNGLSGSVKSTRF